MSYVWSAVGGNDIRTLAGRAFEALKPGGLVLIHDFMDLRITDIDRIELTTEFGFTD